MTSQTSRTSRIPLIAAGVLLWLVLPVGVLGLVLVAALAGAVPGGGCGGDGGPGGGSQQLGGRVWSAEQTTNAQTIVARALARGLPERAAVIAVSTALVETQLRNDDFGDHDSLGLFQQRPSEGWGTPATILNPRTATDTFYGHLLTIPDWERLRPGIAAQDVQHSGHPDRYAPQETAAAALVARFWPSPNGAPPPPAPAPDTSPATSPVTSPAVSPAGVPVCPDDGASNLPLTAGPLDRSGLPPGFTPPADPEQARAVRFALDQVGKRYVFGGKGPDAFDCSGLTQAAWAAAGVGIAAGTLAQIHDGTAVTSLADLEPGDLLFIPGALGTPQNPRHVGLFAGDGVVVDAYDSRRGVITEKLDDWRTKITAIRRIAPTSAGGGGAGTGAPQPGGLR